MSSLSPNLINERDHRTEVARLLAFSILRRKIRLNRQKKQYIPLIHWTSWFFQAFMPMTKNQKTKEFLMSHENKELTERERLQIELGQLPAGLVSEADRQKEVAHIVGLGWQRLHLKQKKQNRRR